MTWRTLLVAAGAVALVAATVFAFRAFDAHSHSASDTLRPFLITMAPLWTVAIGAARIVLRGRGAQ